MKGEGEHAHMKLFSIRTLLFKKRLISVVLFQNLSVYGPRHLDVIDYPFFQYAALTPQHFNKLHHVFQFQVGEYHPQLALHF